MGLQCIYVIYYQMVINAQMLWVINYGTTVNREPHCTLYIEITKLTLANTGTFLPGEYLKLIN